MSVGVLTHREEPVLLEIEKAVGIVSHDFDLKINGLLFLKVLILRSCALKSPSDFIDLKFMKAFRSYDLKVTRTSYTLLYNRYALC